MLPPDPADTTLNHVLVTVLAAVIWAWVLFGVLWVLRRRRPEMEVGLPVAVGYGLRLLAIAAVTATGLGSVLRGGDEVTFLDAAHVIAAAPFSSSAWLPFGHYGLHEILFALQLRLGGFTADAMRCTEVGLAMLGTTLIIVAVYDLGGSRPSRLTAWLLALEPASIFFSEVLHKDPLMILASGLLVFGGAKVWRQLSPSGIALMVLGALIGIATRPYAGWFLGGAAVLVTLHASVRNLGQARARSLSVLIAVVGVIVVVAPAVLAATSGHNLQVLQASQTANASAAGTAGNSLALEEVNFSTRGAIITNLPQRIADLLLRPWPWQIGDASQQVGVVGTLVAYVVLYMLVLYGVRARGHVFDTAGPLLYPLLFLMVAYALSVGNAGTGFRYRTHLVTLGIATAVLLRERWLRELAAEHVGRVRARDRLAAVRGLVTAPVAGAPPWRDSVLGSPETGRRVDI